MDTKLKNVWSILRWFWEIARSLRLQAGLNAILGVWTVGLDFAFIWATKLTIDIATGRMQQPTIQGAAMILIGLMLLQLATGFIRRWISALLGVHSQNTMQLALFRRLLQNEWMGRETHHSGDVLNRLERDVRDVVNVVTETLPATLSMVVRFFGACWILWTIDPWLTALIVLIAPFFAALSRTYVRKMRHITRQTRDTDSLIQSILQESIQHRMVLKTLERTSTMAQRLEDSQQTLRQQVRHRTLFSSTSALLLNTGFAIGYLATFLWGAHRLMEGTITYSMMIAFVQLVGQIQGPFREATRFVPVIISAFTSGERLMELEEAAQEEQGAPLHFTESTGIRLCNVTYAYEQKKRNILQDFSFDFPPGSSTAILGETGAGKTTLIRLVLALIKPQRGNVEMYTATQSAIASPLTRCNLVYVPQGNTLFSGSIRYNLLLGNPDATEGQLHEALQQACADFVFQLPDGLDTLCGENGAGMSEGQAQRVSIARALLRQGNILLLDEATSALDTETEKRLLRNLTQWMRPEQTLLFVTHRPAVIDYCTQTLHLRKVVGASTSESV